MSTWLEAHPWPPAYATCVSSRSPLAYEYRRIASQSWLSLSTWRDDLVADLLKVQKKWSEMRQRGYCRKEVADSTFEADCGPLELYTMHTRFGEGRGSHGQQFPPELSRITNWKLEIPTRPRNRSEAADVGGCAQAALVKSDRQKGMCEITMLEYKSRGREKEGRGKGVYK